ncbi:MAG: TrkH family potassium uptake protein [Candidatus Eisenbacteria bacterium]|nr:TrkH family potassium uptake protein [Candidatus Eisenbacteria bacterium]
MRNRLQYFRPVLEHLGVITWVFGLSMIAPLAFQLFEWRAGEEPLRLLGFGLPVVGSVALGLLLGRKVRPDPIDARRAMILTALAWIVVSAIGAIPIWFVLRTSFLDAYFETVSGLTTTGITMLQGLDAMPRSILFWRAFIQWLGGLGILAFFLAIVFMGGSAHALFTAESHKISSKRPAPGLFHTLRILWIIYAGYTALIALALVLEGMGPFDAVAHSMTALSTGGYSPHDASIGFYAQAGYPNATLIEYTVIVGMLLGGINFVVHSRLLTGKLSALWDTYEMRLFWGILAASTGLIVLDHGLTFGFGSESAGGLFRTSLFQASSIFTTTGFATRDIGTGYFPEAAKQVFLALMLIGGCVGSTGGGVKVLRLGILWKMVGRQLRRFIYGPDTIQPIVLDGEIVREEELRRVGALFFAWIGLLGLGGLITAVLTGHGALASASGMFSALGNIGPCYISAGEMTELPSVVKVTYIFGMLAGRLEILPLLLILNPRTWR